MKVAFDYQIFSNQQYGGISRYFTELIRSLGSQENVSPKLLLPICVNPVAKSLPSGYKVGINLPHVPGTLRYFRYVNRRCSGTLIRLVDPEIVHETYYPRRDPRPYQRARTVTTVHDMIHELFPERIPSKDRTAEFKKRAVQRADQIICVSENTRRDLVRIYGIDQNKTSVVHLGVDHFSYSGPNSNSSIDSPYLLYVGLRNSYKNFTNALTAFGSSSSLKSNFSMICFGGGEFTDDELDLAKSLSIPQNKLRHYRGNDRVLKELYQNASALIYPSIYEGFGIPPLEAMQQRCPVVSSNRASLTEVLGDAAEYFDPYDIEQIRDAIERVVSDPIRADELRRLGADRAQGFTWKKCAQSTLKIYESLVQ